MISKDYTLEIVLTPLEQRLADEYLEIYETILGKKIGLEKLFKISMFHNLQINKSKKIILDNYDIDELVITQLKVVMKHDLLQIIHPLKPKEPNELSIHSIRRQLKVIL